MENFLISDQLEREKVLDIAKSFIVEAPAGSGKTSLLMQRYLALLSKAQKSPEEILAITFTRKAAQEMRDRIINALISATLPPPCDPHKLTIWKLAKSVLEIDQNKKWNILKNPNRLSINTIDGFCANIALQMPMLTNFGGQLNILEDEDAKECYRKAARYLLLSINEDPPYIDALNNLLLHLDNDWQKTEKLLADMLQKRDQWLPHIASTASSAELQTTITNSLRNIVKENLKSCQTLLCVSDIDELLNIIRFIAPEAPTLNEIQLWKKIATLLLTKDFSWRSMLTTKDGFPNVPAAKEMKQKALNLLEKLKENDELRENLKAFALSPTIDFNEQEWLIVMDLIVLLKALASYYLPLVFREKNVTDYIAISLAADQALGKPDAPTELALRLDYQIHHILIDEFQDTSLIQYRLLEKLTSGWQPNDGRTLFLVGDPTQSIYKFRDAKVGLFLRVKQYGINSLKLETITLHTNFRSAKNLIDWANKTFVKVFPLQEKIGYGAVKFIQSNAIYNKEEAKVSVHFFKEEEQKLEAEQIASIIQQSHANDKNTNIAILVRNRTHLLEVIPALRRSNIEYSAVELETLAQSLVIRDLFSLTKALLNLSDRIAWLSILRTPWCCLSLNDIHLIANTDFQGPLWNTLYNFQNINLSEHAKQNLTKVVPILDQSLTARHRTNLRSFVENTWLALSGHNYLNQGELNAAKVYFDLLDKYDNSGYLEDTKSLENKLNNLYAKSNANLKNKVQIMTIHKAKGLEFDTVILPGLDRTPKNDDSLLLMWGERISSLAQHNSDLILAPINATENNSHEIYRYLKFEDKKRHEYEMGRLLYVAITRAKRNVHLLACINDEKPKSGSLLSQLWPALC